MWVVLIDIMSETSYNEKEQRKEGNICQKAPQN